MLRLGHLYGPGTSFGPGGGFGRQLRAGKVPLVGDGGAVFSFTHAHDAATAILAAADRVLGGVLNIVDDDPTPVRAWLPEMAAMLGAPTPRRVPAWLARLLVGGWGVAFMTGLAGASNARARAQLDWKPTYSSWQDGLTADLSEDRIARGCASSPISGGQESHPFRPAGRSGQPPGQATAGRRGQLPPRTPNR